MYLTLSEKWLFVQQLEGTTKKTSKFCITVPFSLRGIHHRWPQENVSMSWLHHRRNHSFPLEWQLTTLSKSPCISLCCARGLSVASVKWWKFLPVMQSHYPLWLRQSQHVLRPTNNKSVMPASWRSCVLYPTDSPSLTDTRLRLWKSLWQPSAPPVKTRLLHSPSLKAIGQSVGYATWPPIGWHHLFVIGWSKYRLGLPSAPLHYGLMWPVGIPTIFQTPVTVPLHCPNSRRRPAVRAVQGDCEGV